MPEYLIKGEMTTLVGLYVTGMISKALRCQKVFMFLLDVQDTDPYTCA